jgi:SAM-dependent methyltransferase
MLPKSLSQSLPVLKLKAGLFVASRRHYAGTRRYGAYRLLQLREAVSRDCNIRALPAGFGRWLDERIIEYPWLFSHLPAGPGRLLDAGSTLNHDYVLAHEKLANKSVIIMTLAPEENCFWRRGISYLYGDLRNTRFRNEAFDCIVSLSVIEHVGLDNRMYAPGAAAVEPHSEGYLDALREFHRILRPGGECYISVPFGKHSLRKWLQVFDGAMIDYVVEAFAPQSHTEEYFAYSESAGWQPATRESAADSVYFDVHADKPWPGCPAAAGAVACLRLVK